MCFLWLYLFSALQDKHDRCDVLSIHLLGDVSDVCLYEHQVTL